MSILLQDIVKKIRFTTFQELHDTVNINLGNLDENDKIKLEQDQNKIIEEFRTQAIVEISYLQRRLININRELFEIQQNELEIENTFQIKNSNKENEEFKNQNDNRDFDISLDSNKKNEESVEKDDKLNSQTIYLQKVLQPSNLSRSQNISSKKTTKTNKNTLNMTNTNLTPKKNIKTQRKNPTPKKNSDSSSSSTSFSKREIKHMEKNSDIYHQSISNHERDNQSYISYEASQKSNSIKHRKRIEKIIYNFREEVKNIGSQYPKKKKI